MKPPARVAVLASGGGSNLQALLDFQKEAAFDAGYCVVLVLSDKRDAGVLARAEEAHVKHQVISGTANAGADISTVLREHDVELVVLAGYLRLLPADVVNDFAGRIINIHPAPLPAFGGKGMHGLAAHEAVIAAGETSSGATVHFVNERYDDGAPIAFYQVPVREGDTPAELGSRVLRAEHVLLPRVTRAVAQGVTRLGTFAFDPDASDDTNARALDLQLASLTT